MAFPPPTEKQAKILWTSITALAVGILLALIAALLLGVAWVANTLSAVLIPLAIAGIVAYLLDPLVDWFHKKRGMQRQSAIILVFTIALLLVGGLVASIVPALIGQATKLTTEFPKKAKVFQQKVSNLVSPDTSNSSTNAPPDTVWFETSKEWAKSVGLTNDKAREITVSAVSKISAWLLDQLKKVTSLFGFLAGLALVPVYVFYFLLEKRSIKRNWTDYLPVRESKVKDEIVFVLHSINDCMIVFFRSQVLVAMCVGTLLTVGFLALGLDYAILLGVMAGLLGIIPYLGVALSIIPAFILSMVQFVPDGDWLKPILILVWFAAVQAMEGFFISPKIIGDRVGLHPLTIIIAIMIGTTLLGGIVGGVLAIPLTAVLRTLMFRYVWVDRVHTSGANS